MLFVSYPVNGVFVVADWMDDDDIDDNGDDR